jgi:hypothetical protein
MESWNDGKLEWWKTGINPTFIIPVFQSSLVFHSLF